MSDTTKELGSGLKAEFLHARGYGRSVSLRRIRNNRTLANSFSRKARSSLDIPDLVYAEMPSLELAEAASSFATEKDVPFICDIQDIWPDVYLTCLPRWLHPIGRLVLHSEYKRLRRIIAGTRGVTAVSLAYLKWAQQQFLRFSGNDRVFELGYGLPDATVLAEAAMNKNAFLRTLGLEPDVLIITFLGQFATSYDLDTVVAAATILADDPAITNYRIVMAGDGDKAVALKKRAKYLNNMLFTGWMEYSRTISLLTASHIALAAYKGTAMQSLPCKPFEYMAFGLPIINSLPGELAKIVEGNRLGINYVAGSATSLVSAISRLIKHPQEREACGARAKALFDARYDSATIYRKMADFLCECVEK